MPGRPPYQNLPPFGNKLSSSNLRIHNTMMFFESSKVGVDLEELSKITTVIHSNAKITRLTVARIIDCALLVKLIFRVDFSPQFVKFSDRIPEDFNELNLPHFDLCQHVCSQHIKQEGRGVAHIARVNSQRLDVDISLIDLCEEDVDNVILICKHCPTHFQSSAKVTNNAHVRRMSYEVAAMRCSGKSDENTWHDTWARAFCELANSTFLTPSLGVPPTCCDPNDTTGSYFPPVDNYFCVPALKGGWAEAYTVPKLAARDSGFEEDVKWEKGGYESCEAGKGGDWEEEVVGEGPSKVTGDDGEGPSKVTGDDGEDWEEDIVEGPLEMTEGDVERLAME
ncbi:hypothetical protein GLAREA_08541 [Glarea lozoyensis ATCC 20868]|nr:uncharacterized protein GLAREA_08541 [Glarea lozoyensis ATCC 20868]EPE24688.1 hypothetical protein GLAREA_08541 [Glarea lozoyensis ATCC 20868]